ncbi:MAG TPA: hypothetical protein VHY32_03615 [Caulobacteraceae bacterium]|jgi:hypothetical protein|nr:hypothetical protein [Caulobacteraceae bacterium]
MIRFSAEGLNLDEVSAANLNARIEQAIYRAGRVKVFQTRFPPIDPSSTDLLPAISWEEIERQLRSLAGPDFERASWELEALKASARTCPPEMFYRELLTLAWSLIDETRPPSTTEADMD